MSSALHTMARLRILTESPARKLTGLMEDAALGVRPLVARMSGGCSPLKWMDPSSEIYLLDQLSPVTSSLSLCPIKTYLPAQQQRFELPM